MGNPTTVAVPEADPEGEPGGGEKVHQNRTPAARTVAANVHADARIAWPDAR